MRWTKQTPDKLKNTFPCGKEIQPNGKRLRQRPEDPCNHVTFASVYYVTIGINVL